MKRATASGVFSAVLTTQQLPKARAAAILVEASASGAFQGEIRAATPAGSRTTKRR